MWGSVHLTDELFEADPKQFVGARDRLAKELRAEGRREDAESVKRLRRPSVSAWALNGVARHHPAAVAKLLTTVEDARAAQDEVLSGGDREALRRALADRRHALHGVLDEARKILDGSGRSPDAATREIEAFLQGTLTPTSIDALRRGELTDLGSAGEDDADELSALLAASVPDTPAPHESAATRARRQKRAAEVERLETELDEAAAALSTAEDAVGERERDLRAAARARDDAQRRVDDAQHALDRARAELERE